jgi:hypothetical protein
MRYLAESVNSLSVDFFGSELQSPKVGNIEV